MCYNIMLDDYNGEDYLPDEIKVLSFHLLVNFIGKNNRYKEVYFNR